MLLEVFSPMPGFACVIAKHGNSTALEIECDSLCPVEFRKTIGSDYSVYQYVSTKFADDKIFTEDEDIFVLLDGIVLNFQTLQKQAAAADYFQTIKSLYQVRQDTFMKELRGDFSGILYDKRKQEWLIFTNQTGTKPLFYYQDESTFVFGSALPLVVQVLQKLGRKYTLDVLGCYFLLTYGFMLEDYTLIQEVKKLPPGNFLHVENQQLQVHTYHRFQNAILTRDSQEEIIANLDHLFKKAVSLEYEKDREYGYEHVATLSGGLDSRMNVCMAWEMGFRPILNLTFSQSDYLEEKIAKKISSEIGMDFLFYALDNGNYLVHTLSEAVRANGGLVFYSGAAHALSFCKLLNFEGLGMIHSGQLGDAFLGTYLSKPQHVKPECTSGAVSARLFDKISSEAQEIANNYDSEELFIMHNRGFNGVVNGFWMVHAFTEAVSPFLDVELIEYALRIPPDLRFEEKIYLEWIRQKCPLVAKYRWEKTGKKITAGEAYLKIIKFSNKVKRKILRDFLKVTLRKSMNPFQYWYETNKNLKIYMDDYFQQNLFRLDPYPEFQRDAEHLYHSGTSTEKTQVMTLLEALKLYFP